MRSSSATIESQAENTAARASPSNHHRVPQSSGPVVSEIDLNAASSSPRSYAVLPQQNSIPAIGGGGLSAAIGTNSIPASSTHGGPATGNANKRLYRAGENRFVTRDIAALDFLLGIPLAAEGHIVQLGFGLQQKQREDEDDKSSDGSSRRRGPKVRGNEFYRAAPYLDPSKGTWWEKWVKPASSAMTPSSQRPIDVISGELELPTPDEASRTPGVAMSAYAPGRRLDGDEAVRIQIPLTSTGTITKQKAIARISTVREWERQTAHGINANHPPMLDGRIFFSAAGSYPINVYSVIRYEPRREEAAFRRKKLESLGGGGTQFVMPTRDWRGISYRVLLPRRTDGDDPDHIEKFNRFLGKHHQSPNDHNNTSEAPIKNRSPKGRSGADADEDDDVSTSSESSDDSNGYVPGLLDDPNMVLGRHRTVMMGDRVTGPIVSSTIQFVKPALLKVELNKQFRERFDGWEPPRSARRYIGAYVSVKDGKYVLQDPAEDYNDDNRSYERSTTTRSRQGSVTSASSVSEGPKEKTIRMPPSLTLSKIRSLKQQALVAAVKAKVEVGTVALACVYFERLCLDCRVDKSNRRLCFAACLLLASKINEPNIGLVMRQPEVVSGSESAECGGGTKLTTRLHALVRPTKRSNVIFASLLQFFTEDWNLSLKQLFHAEWGVFVALRFSLDATPSQVAFHFRRLMKTLERSPREYLGAEMWTQWQEALTSEEERRKERERRREIRQKRKEERLVSRQLELQNQVLRRTTETQDMDGSSILIPPSPDMESPTGSPVLPRRTTPKKSSSGFLNMLGVRRVLSVDRLDQLEEGMESSDIPSNNRWRMTTTTTSTVTGESSITSNKKSLALARLTSMKRNMSESEILAIDITVEGLDHDASSIGSFGERDDIV